MSYFKIKNISINHKGILAPMQEYTHLPFRMVCKDYKAGLTVTEMISVDHVLENKEDLSKVDLLSSVKEDAPSAVQLFGDFKLKKTIDAISLLDDYKYFDIIDLNLGCPSKKVIDSKSGSYNLKQIEKIFPIIKEACKITKKPITIKTRLGFNKNEIDLIVSNILKTDVSALTVHARLATDNYSIKPKFEAVINLKEKLDIPLIYNGDVSLENINLVNDFQGVMVGRASLGNPYIFFQIDYFSKKSSLKENLSYKDQLSLFLKYVKKYPISFQKLKLSVIPFFKGEKGSARIRDLISKSKSEEELITIINKLLVQQ